MSGFVGLHLGPYFAQIPELHPGKFFPVLGLNAASTLKRSQVSSTAFAVKGLFFEKLFHSPLGGRVAQITSVDAMPLVQAFLSQDQSARFEVNERVHANGEVGTALRLEDLQNLLPQLREKKIERVCLQFLHQGENPTHSEMASQFFRENGFAVFWNREGMDRARFRKTFLDAVLQGAWEDLQTELGKLEGLSFQFDFKSPSDSFPVAIRGLVEGAQEPVVLFAGLEKWFLIRTDQQASTLRLSGVEFHAPGWFTEELSVQPTTEVDLNSDQEVGLGKRVLGFEPGPVRLGRSLKLTVFDLFENDNSGLSSPTAEAKTLSQLEILKRASINLSETTVPQLRHLLLEQVFSQVTCDLRRWGIEKFEVRGLFAPIFERELMRRGFRAQTCAAGKLQ